MTMHLTSADAVESAHRDRVLAERALRRSELERTQNARALELDLAPMRLDEAARARLRAAYADAAAQVERHQRAFDRALAIEQAARVLADAITEEPGGTADGLVQLLEWRQRSRPREVSPVSARSRRTSTEVRAQLH